MAWLILAAIVLALALAYWRVSGSAWALGFGVLLITYGTREGIAFPASTWVLAAYVLIVGVLNFTSLRRLLISNPLLGWYRRILPAMSQTEQEAIDAGTVWWDGDLFSGRPDWAKLLALPAPRLSVEEQAFIDNECEQLCAMANDWDSTHVWQDLSPAVWQFIKEKGFLGMIIPKEHGGKGFSAVMHSAVIQKLSSRCSGAAVSVMVPNSLGPAELLLHYGTPEQKSHYLPRLAQGLEIPCFGLTNPNAGSDAASIPDFGIVCRGTWEGREVLGMRVTWEKRYITLGPIATLLGLAIRLYDPDGLLGGDKDVGITCVLVPTQTPGVNIGRRHWPLNATFQNGPNSGKDVFMPLDWIIGGQRMAGQGWRMLMECLAAGRSISLPSSAVGYAKLAARSTGGYARVRSQFKLAIGRFEGVEEALATIGGNLYMMDAARRMTAGSIDLGEKPSVISAIVKYHLTERGRTAVMAAMDVLGGKGICLGPSNFMGRAYQQLPIAITVEGANILTRSLIIFGQGAIRCHPYVLAEMKAVRDPEPTRGSKAFDIALWSHIRFTMSNKVRALFHGLTGAAFAGTPAAAAPELRGYYRQVTRFSAALAYVADVSMLVLGGSLKRREKLSARLGDVLALMYLISATLKRYEDDGRHAEDLPFVHWSVQHALHGIESAFDGLFANYPNALLRLGLRWLVFPLGRHFDPPVDRLGHEIARTLITASAARDRLTAGMYVSHDESDVTGAIEAALAMATEAEAVESKIRNAQKIGTIRGESPEALAEAALANSVITAEEKTRLARYHQLRQHIIAVDDFEQDFGRSALAESQRPESHRAPARAAA